MGTITDICGLLLCTAIWAGLLLLVLWTIAHG